MSPETTVDRRTFLKAAGGAAATASLAGCIGDGGDGGGDGDDGGDGGSGGTLVYARGDHPENYDPQQTTSGEVAKVTNQIFDQLIQFDPGSRAASGRARIPDSLYPSQDSAVRTFSVELFDICKR